MITVFPFFYVNEQLTEKETWFPLFRTDQLFFQSKVTVDIALNKLPVVN